MVPDSALLVDVELASALELDEPDDVTFPEPGVDVVTGRTVVESLAGQLVTSGPQLVIVITSVVNIIPLVAVGWEVVLLLAGYGALEEGPRLSEELPEAPVANVDRGTDAPVPTLLVKEVVL